MARHFDGDEDKVQLSSKPAFASDTQGTIFFHYKLDLIDSDRAFYVLSEARAFDSTNDEFLFWRDETDGSITNHGRFLVRKDGVDITELRTDDGILNDTNPHTMSLSSDGSTVRCYKDGSEITLTPRLSHSNDGQWCASAGTDFDTFTIGGFQRDSLFWDFPGDMAEFCVWDVKLTDEEQVALANGVSPSMIRPGNIRFYVPMHGIASPEAELSGNQENPTVSGATKTDPFLPIGRYAPMPKYIPLSFEVASLSPKIETCTQQAVTGNSTSATVVAPSGIQDDDIILVYCGMDGSPTTFAISGFAEFNIVDETSVSGRWLWKRASSESGNYSLTWSGSQQGMIVALRVSGCITSGSPIDVEGATNTSAGATTLSATALTSTVIDTLAIAAVAVDRDRVDVSDGLSTANGFSELSCSGYASASSGGANGAGMIIAEKDIAGAESSLSPTFGTWASDGCASRMFNLIPAVAFTTFTKTFTIDTVHLVEATKTFTIDSVHLKEADTKTFTIDSVHKIEATKTFTIDSVHQTQPTKTFTIDSVHIDIGTKTFTIDSVHLKAFTKTFTIDTVHSILGTKTFTIDTVHFKVSTKDFTIDSVHFKVSTKTFTIDSVHSKVETKDFTIDTVHVKGETKTFTIDTVHLKVETKTFTIDTVHFKVSTKTFTIDTVHVKVETKAFTIDTVHADLGTKTFTIDTVHQKEFTKTFTIDSVHFKVSTKTFTIDSVHKALEETKTFTIDSFHAVEFTVFTKDFTIDSVHLKVTTKTFTIDTVHELISLGGGRGGKSKQVGVSIYDVDQSIPPKRKLNPQWKFKVTATFTKPQNKRFEAIARFKQIQKNLGFSLSLKRMARPEKITEAIARFRWNEHIEYYLRSVFERKEFVTEEIKAKWSYQKIINLLESYVRFLDEKKTIHTFTFKEKHSAWKVLTEVDAFAHSSTFIGRVIWDEESLDMSIVISGKTYVFCGVGGRTFEGFRGSDSKGAYFNRIIKGQFDC